MLKIDNQKISKIKYGDSVISKIYYGNNLIYQQTAPAEYTFVEQVLTDTWHFSDGGDYGSITFISDAAAAGGKARYVITSTLGESSETIAQPSDINNDTDTQLTFYLGIIGSTYVYTAYREYTPAHWEDADGNWVKGSWSAWDDQYDNEVESGASTTVIGTTQFEYINDNGDGTFTYSLDMQICATPTKVNDNLIYYEVYDMLIGTNVRGIATRVWTSE